MVVKKIIKDLKKDISNIDLNILKSVENINLDQIMGYFSKDKNYNYLDEY